METSKEIIWSAKLIFQLATVFGWFWLIVYSIFRFGCFRKRTFSFLVFVYFGRATAAISEMVVYDFSMAHKLWVNIIMNGITIVGFYLLSARIMNNTVKYKK